MRWRRNLASTPYQVADSHRGLDVSRGALPSTEARETPLLIEAECDALVAEIEHKRQAASTVDYQANKSSSIAKATTDDQQITRWHRSRSNVANEPVCLHEDFESITRSIPISSLSTEERMLHRALQESLGLASSEDMPLDPVAAGLGDWSPDEANEEYAFLQAMEASIHEQDLEDAKKSWAEAAKVPDSNPPQRSKLQAAIANVVASSSTPDLPSLSAASNTSRARNLRRSKKRAELRGEAWEPQRDVGYGGCVVLVREDCRLHDNPALHCASQEYDWCVLVYVHDEEDPSPWPVRGAGLWWRHASLEHFDSALRGLGSQLVFRRGRYIEEVVNVVLEVQACAVLFNRQLEPWYHRRDLELQRVLGECLHLDVKSFCGMVLSFEPWDVRDHDKPKSLVERCAPTVTGRFRELANGWPRSLCLTDLGYGRTAGRKIPPGFRQFNVHRQAALEGQALTSSQRKKAMPFNAKVDDWAYEMAHFWTMGEEAAMARLEEWILDASWGCYYPPGLNPRDSAGGRFRADRKWTAILSPYLRFGDLSPRYVYWRCREALPHDLSRLFLKRIFLRDKAYAQLYKWPDSHTKSIRPQYDKQLWSGTATQLRRWQRGETGFPLVDAAMRQLWKVGWICNHLRHVTAQFLIEHLDLSWKDGFAWYDYTLVDTDVAINAMMWQMGGHSGIGSWNFVMHPIFAGKKVDPEGAYVRRWIPELAGLPVEYIHTPWEAPMHAQLAGNAFVYDIYWQRIVKDLVAARLTHQRNVIALRKEFPQFVKDDGNEIIVLDTGEVRPVSVRDDIRENDTEKITLMMTADDPRSNQRRKLVSKNGVHTSLIFEESKRFESMYDL